MHHVCLRLGSHTLLYAPELSGLIYDACLLQVLHGCSFICAECKSSHLGYLTVNITLFFSLLHLFRSDGDFPVYSLPSL